MGRQGEGGHGGGLCFNYSERVFWSRGRADGQLARPMRPYTDYQYIPYSRVDLQINELKTFIADTYHTPRVYQKQTTST